jgi:hypothetical protein
VGLAVLYPEDAGSDAAALLAHSGVSGSVLVAFCCFRALAAASLVSRRSSSLMVVASTRMSTHLERISCSEGRSNFSWLGLIGLAGVAGLMRKGNNTTDTRSSGIR